MKTQNIILFAIFTLLAACQKETAVTPQAATATSTGATTTGGSALSNTGAGASINTGTGTGAGTGTGTTTPLTGTWKWVLATGGIANQQQTPQSLGYNMFYYFKTNDAFLITKNADSLRGGHYSVGVDAAGLDTVGMGGAHHMFYYTIRKDTLFLTSPCCDMYNYTLVKQ
ncbi:MAG: hypothetical protein H7257_07080 [Taibaiella sp.]|nr:hypothetical protein [Taibaiella sp.]